MSQTVPNVLAARYASDDMSHTWSPEHKVVLERQLWLAVLEAQADLGIDVPDGVIEAYRSVVDDVDLDSIDARERITRHDVKARIDEFSALAGHEQIHKGMTSRDLTENVEQLQVRQALVLVRGRMLAALALLAQRAAENATLVMTGRTHNVPAQATTLGKRFANAGEELLQALHRVDDLLARYPLRGIKGPVGTQQDMLDLLDGDVDRLDELERRVAAHLGFEATLSSVGQVYPRSLDLDVVSALVQAAAGPADLATHHPPDGRPGAGHRGLPARAGGLLGHAPQDEQPQLRAHRRAPRGAAGPSHDGGGAGRRPVERGRRELLGGAPGRPARRLLRPRRPVRDLPHRARRLRRVPGRHRARARPLPPVPRHHQGADGRGAPRGGPRAGPRGDQGERRGRRPAPARGRRRKATTSSNGWPPTSAWAWVPTSWPASWPSRSTSWAPHPSRSPPSSPPWRPWSPPIPRPLRTAPATSSDGAGRRCRGPPGVRSGRHLHGRPPGAADAAGDRPVSTDELPHLYSGKVRDIYDAGDGRLLMVTSDRLSAFDVVMAEPIPDKGRVLTAMSAFWFEQLDGVVGNHLLSTRLDDLPEGARRPEWAGRVMLCTQGRDAADRVHRAGLHRGVGVEGVPRRRARCTAPPSPPISWRRRRSRSRCSPRRPRPTRATT